MPDDILNAAQQAINDAAKAKGVPAEPAPSVPAEPAPATPVETGPTSSPIQASVNPTPVPAAPVVPPAAPTVPQPIETKKADDFVNQLLTNAPATTPSSVTLTDSLVVPPASGGSDQKSQAVAAPPANKPKKKNVAAIVVGLFLFLGVLATGAYFVAKPESIADDRSRAARELSCFDECRKDKGTKVCNDRCGTQVTPGMPQDDDNEVISGNTKEACEAGGRGFWCGKYASGCGGFCISGRSQTCSQALADACPNDAVQTGANFIVAASCSGAYYKGCTCTNPLTNASVNVCFNRGITGNAAECSEAGKTDRLCNVYANSINSGQVSGTPIPAGTTMYFCENQFLASENRSCTGRTITSIPNCFCGTIQIDTNNGGYQSREMRCGCNESRPTATPTSIAPICLNIKIFGDGAQLAPSQISPGDTVTLAVKGNLTPTKAHFRINGGEWQETTTKNANGEFTLEYTFPEGVSSFVIEAEVFTNGAWW